VPADDPGTDVSREASTSEPVTTDFDLLEADLTINFDEAVEEPDAFQRATEEEVDGYINRLRDIAKAGERALADSDR
jgi:hypothetical protein